MSLAAELGEHLGDEVTDLTYDPVSTTGNVFLGSMPPSPDEAIEIHVTGGPEASTKDGYAMPTAQVVVRGTTDPRTGEDLADAVYDELHGLRYVTLPGGTFVVSSTGIQSGPVSLGEDEKGRHRYSLNFRLHVRRQTTHSIE